MTRTLILATVAVAFIALDSRAARAEGYGTSASLANSIMRNTRAGMQGAGPYATGTRSAWETYQRSRAQALQFQQMYGQPLVPVYQNYPVLNVQPQLAPFGYYGF